MKTLPIVLVLFAILASACAPVNSPGGAPAGANQAQPSGPKILVAGNVEDPKNMWDGINGGGGSGSREFFPLPKHLVEAAYLDSKETLISQPYFSTEYVGTGPFKISSWDHGNSMEMVANDNYFLGRPKIDRMKVVFIADPNTALANLQAGALNTFLPPGGPDLDRLTPLREEWKSTGQGTVAIESVRWRFLEPQKSSIAQPSDLT